MYRRIDQQLRIDKQICTQLLQGFLCIHHNFQQLHRSQKTVSCIRMSMKDDMSALLTADGIVMLLHTFKHIFVTDSRLLIFQTLGLQCVIQTKVAHHRGHNDIIMQNSLIVHIAAADIHRVVAINQVSVLINSNQTIRISVKGKADMVIAFLHHTLQLLGMCGTAFGIDIDTVWRRMNHLNGCPQLA